MPQSKKAHIQFHQAFFGLLEQKPLWSLETIKRIERLEGECSRRFPAAVREWYSLEKVDALTNSDLMPRDWVLREFVSPHAPVAYDSTHYLALGGDGGDGSYYVELNGTEDPPVVEENSTCYGDFDMHLIADHFSTFVFQNARLSTRDWQYLIWADGFPLGPPLLDFCREHYQEGPVNRACMGILYHFFGSGFLVQTQVAREPAQSQEPAHLWIHSGEEAVLVREAERLWPFIVEARWSFRGPWQSPVPLLQQFRANHPSATK